MNRSKNPPLLIVAIALSIALTAADRSQANPSFTFQIIDQTTTGFIDLPQLSASGQLAYELSESGVDQVRLFDGTNPAATIFTEPVDGGIDSSSLRINDSGLVAVRSFTSGPGSVSAIQLFDGLNVTQVITEPDSPDGLLQGGLTALNNLGQVTVVGLDANTAETVEFFDGVTQTSLFTAPTNRVLSRLELNNAGQLLVQSTAISVDDAFVVLDLPSSIPQTVLIGSSFPFADFNDAAQIAVVRNPVSAPDTLELLATPGDSPQTIFTAPSQFGVFITDPKLNEIGQVAFVLDEASTPDVQPDILYFFDGVSLAPLFVEDPEATLENYALNDLGKFVLATENSSSEVSLQFYNGAEFSDVLAVGDTLGGQIVTAIDSFGFQLNNSGHIAFQAFLADGREVVVLARPVPEPVAMWLFVTGLGTVGTLRRRAFRE
ncbi:MAG: PEP-CTERM sorting domain-containing protein [Pseudomonadota bacterium]